MSKKTKQDHARMVLKYTIEEGFAYAKQKFAIENPELAGLADCKINPFYYNKRPPGYSKVIPKILELMVGGDGINKTQIALIKEVSLIYPNQNITRSIWQKNLQSYEKKKISDILSKEGFPDNIAKGCNTFAQVRNNLKTYINTLNSKSQDFNTKIVVSEKTIVIGNKSYPVAYRNNRKKDYPCIRVNVADKRHWLRVDILTQVLIDGEKK